MKARIECIDRIDTTAFKAGLASMRKFVTQIFARRSPTDRFWKMIMLQMWRNIFSWRRFLLGSWWRLKLTGKASWPVKWNVQFSYSAIAIENDRKEWEALRNHLEQQLKPLYEWWLKRALEHIKNDPSC